MDYEVSRTDAGSRRTAVVAATTTWQDFPALWGVLLGEVWDCLHAGGIYHGCRNVMLYLDGVPNVEVGVLLDQPCPLTGRVVASALPAGTAAMTVHRAPAGTWGRPMTPLPAGAPHGGTSRVAPAGKSTGRTTTIRLSSGQRSTGCSPDGPEPSRAAGYRPSAGSSTNTGIWRVVFCWYSA
jgi:hypothetical protein